SVVKSICEVSVAYGCTAVIGDQASESWVSQKFAEHGMGFRVSDKSTSECYLASEVFFATGHVELLDDAVQTRQLRLLEKTQRPGGRSIVNQPRGAHDDRAAALCRAIANCNFTCNVPIWSGGHRTASMRDWTDQGADQYDDRVPAAGSYTVRIGDGR